MTSRHIITVILFLLITPGMNVAFGQRSEIDSLLQVVRQSKVNPNTAKAHSRLAWLHIISDPAVAEAHIDTAIQQFRELEMEDGEVNSHYRYAVLYRVTGRFPEAHRNIDIYLDFYKSRGDTAHWVDGMYQKGVLYSLEGNYSASLSTYMEILSAYRAMQDSTSMGFTLNSIGVVHKNLGNLEEARKSYEEALEIHESLGNMYDLADVLMNLGSLEALQSNNEKSIEYFEEANAINEEQNNLWGMSVGYQNIGSSLIIKGDFDGALEYLDKAIELQRDNNYIVELAQSLVHVGSAQRQKGNLAEAVETLKEGIALDFSSLKVRSQLHSELSEAYRQMGRFHDALAQYQLYNNYSDSLFNETSMKNINSLMVQYESERKDVMLKENEIELQQRDAEILRAEMRNNVTIFTLIVLFMVALGFFLYFRQRQKLQSNQIESLRRTQQIQALESFIEGEENERKRLAQDLHDGLNGDLSVIKFAVSSMNGESKGASQKDEVIGLLDKACKQVRSISHNLSPLSLSGSNLEDSVRQYCNRMVSAYPIEIDLQFFGEKIDLDLKRATAVYRMVQEMILNAVKHAEATELMVQFNNHRDELNITVEDNGKGFSPEEVKGGIGLNSIRSRAEFLNADLDLTSGEEGTSYHILIRSKSYV